MEAILKFVLKDTSTGLVSPYKICEFMMNSSRTSARLAHQAQRLRVRQLRVAKCLDQRRCQNGEVRMQVHKHAHRVVELVMVRRDADAVAEHRRCQYL